MAKQKTIKIGKRKIGFNQPPFVIAEMSGNHNQSLERALALVEAAAKAGANALKVQTYTADTMTLNVKQKEFFVNDPASLWHGKSLYQLYQQAALPWDWHQPIFKRCRELGLICFSTPLDETAVDFLESLKVPCYKIASFENTDIALIRKVASTGKPLIISSGMATEKELKESLAAARKAGCKDIILLKCTSAYPSDPKEANLLTIPDMAKRFNCVVGLSDHTMGVGVSLASVALGAAVIEKHFTLDRKDGGVDSAFSLEPAELAILVNEVKKTWQALGKVNYQPTKAEKKSLSFRRSLYAVKDIHNGEKFNKDNLRAIRPGYGLPPKHLKELLGQRVKHNIKRGEPINWSMIKKTK